MKETKEMKLATLLEKALISGALSKKREAAVAEDIDPHSADEEMTSIYTDSEFEETHRQFANEQPLDYPPDFEDDDVEPKRNLELSIQDDILTIVVDLRRSEGISRTGRSEVISSTSGNMQLWDKNGLRTEWLNMSVTRRIPNTKPTHWYIYR